MITTGRTRGRVLLAALALAFSAPASAEFPLSAYRDMIDHPDTKEQLTSYVVGLGRGIFWANAWLEASGKPMMFCMPQTLRLDEGVILSLLDQEIRSPSDGRGAYEDDTNIELILTKSFVSRFPCD